MAKAKTNKEAEDNKVFDVAKPGKTPADASARPVIVGHKAMLKDPMVKEETDAADAQNTKQEARTISTTAPTIMPLSEQKSEKPEAPVAKKSSIMVKDASAETPESETSAKPEPEQPAKKTAPAKEPNTTKTAETSAAQDTEADTTEDTAPKEATDTIPEESDTSTQESDEPEQPQSNDSAAVEAVAEQAGAKKEAQKQSQAEAEKTAAIEEMIIDKKYYAPIGEKKHRRTLLNTLLLLVLAIGLGILLANTLIELEVIQTDIEPPIRIFSR